MTNLPIDTLSLNKLCDNDSSFTTIRINNKIIDATNAKDLAKTLKVNTTITSLELYNNTIDAMGAKDLINVLESKTPLRALDLWNNAIGDRNEQSESIQTKFKLKLRSGLLR